MGWLIKVLKWVWSALGLFGSIAPVLWGVSIYSGLAYAVYNMIKGTNQLISGMGQTFSVWADSFSATLLELFHSANTSSVFRFFSYVLSLDYPFEWFASGADTFIRNWLTSVFGVMITGIEICLVVLGVVWVRSRLKQLVTGLGKDTP